MNTSNKQPTSCDIECQPQKNRFLDIFTLQSSTLVVISLFLLLLFAAFTQNWWGMTNTIQQSGWFYDVFLAISHFPALPFIMIAIPFLGGIIQLLYGQKACHSRDRIVIFMTFLTIVVVMFLYPAALDGSLDVTFPGVI
ncbi:MAG: hypothetical protein IH571_00790, partial [Acholeplasmataceae bacterium]|nr:hypothetical protein [Acholeplasmataceae bacterium]